MMLKHTLKISAVFLCLIICITTSFSITTNASASKSAVTVSAEDSPLTVGEEIQTIKGEIPADGEYNVSLRFRPVAGYDDEIKYLFYIDGELMFPEADALSADIIYVDDGDFITLSDGNQVAAKQKQTEEVMTDVMSDPTGIELRPYSVSLFAGVHDFSVKSLNGSFLWYGLEFSIAENIPDYNSVGNTYNSDKYKGEEIIVEAEKTAWRNSANLMPQSDNFSTDITPRDAKNTVINYIGGSSWNTPGQEIAWQINVPEDGLYRLGFVYKQNILIDGKSFRILKIDGEVPFEEAVSIGFDYNTSWKYENLQNDSGDDYLFYLTEGTHEISLEVTLSEVSAVYNELNQLCEEIGSLYLDIVMITGETPDANRDYELYKQIPRFQETLADLSERLSVLSDTVAQSNSINGEVNGAIRNMQRDCQNMHDQKYKSHLYLSSFYSDYQTLCSWLYDIKNMPLALDKIVLNAPDSKVNYDSLGFIKKIGYSLKSFICSFVKNYNTERQENPENHLKIWVNWGRDQVKVLNTLIQESFTVKTGISVTVQQVNASVIQGIISDNSPDLYLNLARTEPVNLAMRGVLYDLSSFDDYEEVLKQFQEGAEIPYMYSGKCYALPDTQSFYIMFCRDDILQSVGLSAPETWGEFAQATSVLQRKNLNTYLPYTKITAASTVNIGAGGLSLFPTLILQHGNAFYNEAQNGTELNNEESYKVFCEWMRYYTHHKLNPEANFYQRFRSGTIPIGIATYTNYFSLSVAAPEISGKWSVHLIPGTTSDSTNCNHTSAGAGTGCSIMKSTKNPDGAWEFLKWWVSDEVQYQYSSNVEYLLGISGRIATSNVKALSKLSWDRDDLSVILEQWSMVEELPEVPGSYYVSRCIDQAFWEVNNGESDEKEALLKWNNIINDEIKRKISEYS